MSACTIAKALRAAKLEPVSAVARREGRLSGGALAAELRREAERAGLAALGFASATPMEQTRHILEQRKAAGLAAGMQFTYRDPARSTDPGRLLAGASSLVVGAWAYGPAPGTDNALPRSADGPSGRRPTGKVARYATRDYYAELKAALGRLSLVLKGEGWASRVVCDDNGLVDRAAAQRAGLGWFGKNANVLLPGRGSWFVIGSVVTDAPLPAGHSVEPGCGGCRRCLAACPTGALVGPGVLDARKCLAWLVQATGVFPFEYREALGDRLYGCDDCQEVCPPNRAVARSVRGEGNHAEGDSPVGVSPGAGHVGPEVDLLALLAAGDDELVARFGRWYIPRREPRYLRRNALIALGNAAHAGLGPGMEAELVATLRHYLAHPDQMLRAHAVWAAFRAGRPQLVTANPVLGEESSEMVLAEIRRGPEVARSR